MIYDADEYARLRNGVLCVSLLGWIIMLAEPRGSTCCSIAAPGVSFETLLIFNPPASLARDWGLMLIAMMAPTLPAPIYYICINSLARRRVRSVAFFVAGYAGVWMAAGCLLLAGKLGVQHWAPQSYLPAIAVAIVALVWQASPFKQRCLNRCHNHRSLAAFGVAADWDATRLGLEHGFWCTSSCWAAMLFPMLLAQGHFIAMFAVSILMFCERLDPPGTPSWRWRGFDTARRYLILRLRGAQCDPAPWAPIGDA
jgi:predicted metal-binding membrane protein